MYDPSYFMPSQSSYKIQINFEPILGTLSVLPLNGYSMD